MKAAFSSKKTLILVVLLMLLIPAVFPLFQKGFFISDDGEWMVIRFTAFFQTMKEGVLPVRFLGRLNHDYGYPVSNFLYPGYLYLGVFLKLFGMSFVQVIKVLFIFSTLLSGVFMYLWLRSRFKEIPSVIGSLVYVYFPYHMFDLYMRGSLGELLGLCILPLILYVVEKKKLHLAGVLFACLIVSHNSLALIFTPVLFFSTYLQSGIKKTYYLLIGLLLSAFFWIPALAETRYTIFSSVTVSSWQNYFVTIQNFSLVGLSGILIIGCSFFLIWKKRSRKIWFPLVTFFASLFLSFPLSEPLWQIGLFPKIVQFPWRFLLLAVWSGSVIIAATLEPLPRRKQQVLGILFGVLIMLSAAPYILSYQQVVRDEGYYTTNEDTTTVHNEYMPIWVKQIPTTRPLEKAKIISGQGGIFIQSQKNNSIRLIATMETEGMLQIETIYYPGWKAFRNEQAVPIHYQNEQGLIQIPLQRGENKIVTVFSETPLRIFANGITVVSMLVLILYYVFRKAQKTRISHKKK